jgi:hypothetical protein
LLLLCARKEEGELLSGPWKKTEMLFSECFLLSCLAKKEAKKATHGRLSDSSANGLETAQK